MRSSWLLLLALTLTACPKEEKKEEPAAPPSASATASTPPSASTAAAAVPDAALANTGVEDAGPATKDGGAAVKSAGGTTDGEKLANPSGAGVCGKKPLPDCPLQGWMKQNTAAAMASNDLPAVATALEHIVKLAPGSGYPNWTSIAKDGAAAAKKGDVDAVKASCRTCHDQYKNKYKAELRTRPIS